MVNFSMIVEASIFFSTEIMFSFLFRIAQHQLPTKNPERLACGKHHGGRGGGSADSRGGLHAAEGTPGPAERPQRSQPPHQVCLLLPGKTRRRGGIDRVRKMHGDYDG